MKEGWTLEKGIALYREELREYILWVKELEPKYRRVLLNPNELDTEDSRIGVLWIEKMMAMEKVLGLSEKDAGKIFTKVNRTLQERLSRPFWSHRSLYQAYLSN
jgi:hypothetical protein